MSILNGKTTLLMIGAGNMGEAMLRSWVQTQISKFSLLVLEPQPSDWLKSMFEMGLVELNNIKTENKIDICVFAVKPQTLGKALEENRKRLRTETLIVSVVAGKDFNFLKSSLHTDQPIIRVMPNTPVSVSQGISAMVANKSTDQTHIGWVQALFAALGKIVLLKNENEIDAVTAISGSGPAYVFNFIENLIEIAGELGLSAEVSKKLVIQTVVGAGILSGSTTLSPGRLRENVTSPAGTTQAALEVLMDEKFGWKRIIKKAVHAAHNRSKELAGTKN